MLTRELSESSWVCLSCQHGDAVGGAACGGVGLVGLVLYHLRW